MNPDLMRFDLLYKRPPETEPAPKLDPLRRPVLRHDNPARDALIWACDTLGHMSLAFYAFSGTQPPILEWVTAYDVTADGFAFDLSIPGLRPVDGGGIYDGPPVLTRWYATIDYENRRCTRVEVVRRG